MPLNEPRGRRESAILRAMPSPLSRLQTVAPDPIFTLLAQARAAGAGAIDLSIGMILDGDGVPALLPAVHAAVCDIAKELPHVRFGYGPLAGLADYRSAVRQLVLGEDSERVATLSTTGGTGAVAAALQLLRRMDGEVTCIVPVPTWSNTETLAATAGVPVLKVPYLHEGQPSIAGCIEALETATGTVGVLLQAGCHNPTGRDLAPQQWDELLAAIAEHDALLVLDMAYQGLGGPPEEDALPVTKALALGIDTLIAWSGAKNHSLYSERVGCLLACCPSAETRTLVERHLGRILRGMHSGAPLFGQTVVQRVQDHYGTQWREDLARQRATLEEKRRLLAGALPEHMTDAVRGRGMFAVLPLRSAHIQRLKTEQRVFLTDEGRINVAGLHERDIDELAARIRRAVE